MNYQLLAFYTGILASLHCVAMCGPLILSLPFSRQSIGIAILQKILYQAGRILMYSLLGSVLGVIGAGFSFLGLQQVLSITTGILLVGAGMQYFFKSKRTSNTFITKFIQSLTFLLGKHLSKPYGSILAGSLNGLLPCGMVYIALAQAVNLHTPYESAISMLSFGIGTTPLLVITSIAPIFFRRFKTPALLIPALFLVAGTLLIARGLRANENPSASHAIGTHGAPVSICR